MALGSAVKRATALFNAWSSSEPTYFTPRFENGLLPSSICWVMSWNRTVAQPM
jgi:hypothetical protein